MEPKIIPQPQKIVRHHGTLALNPGIPITCHGNEELKGLAAYLADILAARVALEPLPASQTAIHLSIEDISCKTDEAYELDVRREGVFIRARTAAGIFHGIQTLRQLLPADWQTNETVRYQEIPCWSIQDYPRFPWRGMLLDCGRHFMTPDFVKRYIDLLALYKMNVLHWHLTEDQGWRIEIKKYPQLTAVGAWRKYDDGTVYGGFYTQDEIRDVVAYAASRHVRIVPEIEMPGHCLAALAAFPDLSCSGGPFAVETQWGVFEDVYCAGKEKVFSFLEDVLTEVMQLFPSPYIHIGGDEVPKKRWKVCADCQARIRNEKLADEDALQSYFIRRINEFLAEHGRRVIGWDEILEGGVSADVTVQSWRGFEGAIAAARGGHDAIVSPTSHAYFDTPVQTIDLRQVFSFEPVPPGLTAAERRHIIGGECNMWTERAPQSVVDGKMFPRLLAMAERLWSAQNNTDFYHFLGRCRDHYERLERLGVTYGAEAQPVTILPRFDARRRHYEVRLLTGEKNLDVHYTLNGSEPDTLSPRYDKPLIISNELILTARGFEQGVAYGSSVQKEFVLHQAVGKKLRLKNTASPKYRAGGPDALIDGMSGSPAFRDGYWQGFEQDDLDAVIDLGKVISVRAIQAGFLQDVNSWIFFPRRIRFEISQDGTLYTPVAELTPDVSQKFQEAVVRQFRQALDAASARYIRVYAQNIGSCPAWHPGAGGKAWIFADEIRVE